MEGSHQIIHEEKFDESSRNKKVVQKQISSKSNKSYNKTNIANEESKKNNEIEDEFDPINYDDGAFDGGEYYNQQKKNIQDIYKGNNNVVTMEDDQISEEIIQPNDSYDKDNKSGKV